MRPTLQKSTLRRTWVPLRRWHLHMNWQSRFELVLKAIGWTGVLAILALIVLGVAAAVAPEKEYWSEFAKIAGVGLTLLFSIATLISSFSTERLKLIAAKDLEAVKIAAVQEVENTKIHAQAALEELKFKYQAELESEKRKIDFEVKTYEVLMNAISGYYRAIEDTVEKGYTDERFEKADAEMKQADVFSHWLPSRSYRLGTRIGRREVTSCRTARRVLRWRAPAWRFGNRSAGVWQTCCGTCGRGSRYGAGRWLCTNKRSVRGLFVQDGFLHKNPSDTAANGSQNTGRCKRRAAPMPSPTRRGLASCIFELPDRSRRLQIQF